MDTIMIGSSLEYFFGSGVLNGQAAGGSAMDWAMPNRSTAG
jgi:hypothetical protein